MSINHADLDNYITGHWGQDQTQDPDPEEQEQEPDEREEPDFGDFSNKHPDEEDETDEEA